MTLFKVEQGAPAFFASNGNTANNIPGTNNQAVLFTDPALFVTLGQGEYYLAVSATVNFPDPNDPSDTTFFDPTVPQSGSTGNTLAATTTGPYVLNVLVQPTAGTAPHVVAVTPDTRRRPATGRSPRSGCASTSRSTCWRWPSSATSRRRLTGMPNGASRRPR